MKKTNPTQIEENKPKIIRIVIDGPERSGRTSLLIRHKDGKFDDLQLATIGVDFFKKTEIKFNQQITLQIWDAIELRCRFRALPPPIHKNSQISIFLYDITSRTSFDQMIEKLNHIIINQPSQYRIFAIVGSKMDLGLERQITYREGKQLADSYGMIFFEVSSKTAQNVNQLFDNVLDTFLEIV